jgi:hypothetical protein
VRVISVALLLLVLVSSHASGQTLVLQGSAGPTATDAGHSLAARIGFSPASRLTVLFGVDRTHVSSRFSTDGRDGVAAFRGGTVTFAAAELRATIRGRDRVSPYVLGGFGAGVSRPNVNEMFPHRVTNNVRALFFGGGIHVPLRERISVFADARMVVGAEAGELLAIAPVRVGVAWRF